MIAFHECCLVLEGCLMCCWWLACNSAMLLVLPIECVVKKLCLESVCDHPCSWTRLHYIAGCVSWLLTSVDYYPLGIEIVALCIDWSWWMSDLWWKYVRWIKFKVGGLCGGIVPNEKFVECCHWVDIVCKPHWRCWVSCCFRKSR